MTDARPTDDRLELLRRWLGHDLGWQGVGLAPASEDASFRRYFRVRRADVRETWVAMDAPPGKEDLGPYLAIADMLGEIGVHAPRVVARNLAQGFLLLSDLGSKTYLAELAYRETAARLYEDAIDALVRIQARGGTHAGRLPPYDEKLLRFEMSLFTDWLLGRHLGLETGAADTRMLADTFDLLVRNALEQPRVFVHRDYHSRNLMVCPGDNPGILDFQDAVHGPLTYDVVSLLRDCYVVWSEEQVLGWARDFRARAIAAGVPAGRDDTEFLRWFDLMGVQRHLKASGIFARLWHRDGKPGYLGDVPRTLGYIVQVASRHADLADLGRFVAGRVLPALAATRPEQRS